MYHHVLRSVPHWLTYYSTYKKAVVPIIRKYINTVLPNAELVVQCMPFPRPTRCRITTPWKKKKKGVFIYMRVTFFRTTELLITARADIYILHGGCVYIYTSICHLVTLKYDERHCTGLRAAIKIAYTIAHHAPAVCCLA